MMPTGSRIAEPCPGPDLARPPWARWLREFARVEDSRWAQLRLVTAARVVSAALGIGVPVVLVRVFDQTVFGYYKEVFLIAGTATALLTLGLPASLYYFVPRSLGQGQRLLVQSALLLGLLGIVGAVALLATGPLLQRFFHAPLDRYVLWVALFTALAVPVSLLPVASMVDRRPRLTALLVAGFDTLRATTVIGIALWKRDLAAVIGAAAAVIALQVAALVAYLLWRGRWQAWRPQRALLRAQLGYALPFAAAALVGLLRDQLHAYYVSGTVRAAEFAVYAVGLLHIPFIDSLTQTVGEVVVLENAVNFGTGRLDEAQRVWHRAAYGLALILFLVFATAEVFADDLITVLFGPSYAGAVPVFRVYVMLVPMGILLASPLLRAAANLRVMLVADLASLAVTVGALLPLVAAFGPLGAVGSLVVGMATFACVASHHNARRLGLSLGTFLPWVGLARVLATSAAAATLARLALHAAPPAWRLTLGVALSTLMYAILAWGAGLVPAAETTPSAGYGRRADG